MERARSWWWKGLSCIAILAVAVTMVALTAIHRPHPPAGATTLMVSLGILTAPAALASVLGAVVVVATLSSLAASGARCDGPASATSTGGPQRARG